MVDVFALTTIGIMETRKYVSARYHKDMKMIFFYRHREFLMTLLKIINVFNVRITVELAKVVARIASSA
jgi:hypothetical protein